MRTTDKVEQAEEWLLRYLKDGPRPIPDSYIKNGLCRYNYATDELPPEGIGKKTIDIAICNLGIQKLATGLRGGIRWHLPSNDHRPDHQTAAPAPPPRPTLAPEVVEPKQDAGACQPDAATDLNGSPGSPNREGNLSATSDTPEPSLISKVVYELYPPHGPRVLEVPLAGEFVYQSGRLKYYLCDGENKSQHPNLASAISACDELAKRWQRKAASRE